jgi:hypothetical protein
MTRAGTTDDRAGRRAWAGAAMVCVGVVTLGALVYIGNSPSPFASHMMISLGLAGASLLSATAQSLIFGGGWILWRGRRRRAS